MPPKRTDRKSLMKRPIPLVVFTCLTIIGYVLWSNILTESGLKVFRDVPYLPNGLNPSQTLDLFVPPSKNRLPLIVMIHAGSWLTGRKDVGLPPFSLFTENGFAVASLNYRLTKEAGFPAQIHDCKAAIRFLRANAQKYNLDPYRFGVWGLSAGGHLAALLGTTSRIAKHDHASALDLGAKGQLEGTEGNNSYRSDVNAVCASYPITDIVTLAKEDSQGLASATADSPVTLLLRGTVTEKPELAALASPVTYVSCNNPPFMLVHGDHDRVVPYQQSLELQSALTKVGVSCALYTGKNADHDFDLRDAACKEAVLQFFIVNLKDRI
jgi:acetyl esterase/lipase